VAQDGIVDGGEGDGKLPSILPLTLIFLGSGHDYSEQQFVDCAFGQHGADGCVGAWPHAYAKWAVDENIDLTSEVLELSV
jgi:hypothetical protein